MPAHFSLHLCDAIALNTARLPVYAALSGGRSAKLSRRLIHLEGALLPLARWFDRHDEGDLLAGAFVPMTGLPAATRPPTWGSGGSVVARVQVTALLGGLQLVATQQLLRGDLGRIARCCLGTLDRLQVLEARHAVHLAMSRHLVESVGRAATVAAGWSDRRLARRLVGVQLAGLLLAPRIDRLAWACHARGAAILVNDLPACAPLPVGDSRIC